MDTQAVDPIAGGGPGGRHMPPIGIGALALYLTLFTVVVLWQLYAKWPTCDPAPVAAETSSRPAAERPAGTEAQDKTSTPTEPAPVPKPVKVTSVTPKSGDVAGGTTVQVTGEGFLPGFTLTFGGYPASKAQRQSETLIKAETPPHAVGPVNVVVANADGKSGELPEGYTFNSCLEQCRSRLLLLVLLAGALGGCFHALRSLWSYVGDRSLKRSWTLMYIFLPINSAALAFIFFLIISAGNGFFTQPAGSNTCYWIIGIAALVGLFSQQAFEKLKTIADAFFAPPAPRSEPLSKPPVPPKNQQEPIAISLNPAVGTADTFVEIKGSGFTEGCQVTFGGLLATDLQVSPSLIKVKPPAHPPGPVTVTVTNSNGAVQFRPASFTYE